MEIDIIVEPDVSPAQMAELAAEAEKLGIRAIWSSNYHQDYDCFLALAPAAAATSRIILGALAVSPWELHPLKMANAVMTLNEMSNGRAMIAISGGGGVLSATGWKISKNGPVWPIKDEEKGNRYPERRVRGVQECIEVLDIARSGKLAFSYEGEIFNVTRPFQIKFGHKDTGPLIYGCCSGPMMVRMGSRLADGIQVSDFTVDMIPAAMENVQKGLAIREQPAEDFRVGNFWAFHIKEDIDVAMYEARRELIWRGAIAAKYEHEIAPHVDGQDEVKTVIDNWDNFFKAFWTRSGKIDGVPEELVNKLIAGMSSAGDLSALDAEIERYKAFRDTGLTELSLRLFDEPMAGLKIIGDRVLPALRQ